MGKLKVKHICNRCGVELKHTSGGEWGCNTASCKVFSQVYDRSGILVKINLIAEPMPRSKI